MKFSTSYLPGLVLMILLTAACAGSKRPALHHGESSYSQGESRAEPSSRSAGGSDAYGTTSAAEQRRSMKQKGKRAANGKTHADLVAEFEARMEANAKEYKKEAKLAKKPQYSDFSYFGHKKKPKKRPVGKRKFCKECGIVH